MEVAFMEKHNNKKEVRVGVRSNNTLHFPIEAFHQLSLYFHLLVHLGLY